MNSLPEYPIGRTVIGSEAAIRAAYEAFRSQPIDETRLAPSRECPFSLKRTTLAGEASVAGVGTFEGSEKQTLTFAPSAKPGWWIRRMDHPEQLDTQVDIANLWTSAQNLVLRSGSSHNYLRMVEHIIALRAGLGVDDVLIKVNSGDPPLFNDSSMPLVKAIDHAKVVETGADATYVTVREPVAFGGSRGDFLLFLPAEDGERNLRIDCAIRWNTVIGCQRVLFDATPETFRYAAYARTNATRKQYILAQNLFQHSSGNSAGTEDYRLPMAKVKYGGFQADITGTAVQDQGNFTVHILPDMVCGGWTGTAGCIGGRSRHRNGAGFQH